MKKYFIIIILIFLLSGCGAGEKASKSAEPGVVDYLTGHEQIKTYQRTKIKIEDINKTPKERNEGF
ncbi:MAG: lipoprotein [Candidatus Omnitrophota bacterium]